MGRFDVKGVWKGEGLGGLLPQGLTGEGERESLAVGRHRGECIMEGGELLSGWKGGEALKRETGKGGDVAEVMQGSSFKRRAAVLRVSVRGGVCQGRSSELGRNEPGGGECRGRGVGPGERAAAYFSGR